MRVYSHDLIMVHINATNRPKYMLNFKQPSKVSELMSDLNFLAISKMIRVITINMIMPIIEPKISIADM